MDIVAITDKGFVMPTGVMMYSVCVNNPDEIITFHVIIDESVKKNNQKRLSETVEQFGAKKKILFYRIDSNTCKRFPKGCELFNVTYATYYRLFLTEILPSSLVKVLYLDGDIIVRQSLKPLWETDLSNYAIAAVKDSSNDIAKWCCRLGYLPDLGYFNAGVLLINLKYWREKNALQMFTNFISHYPEKIYYHDQDILNAIFKDKKLSLPIQYNLQRRFLYNEARNNVVELKEIVNDPVILHFTENKPWETITDVHPYSSTFFKYQNQTLWKGQRTDRRPLKIQLRWNVGNILRFLGILPPRKIINKFAELSPID